MTKPPSFAKKTWLQPHWLAAILITAVIVWLHIFLWLHAGGFCGDEVNVVNLAGTHSLPLMTHDSFPVLFPLLVSGWTTMGFAKNDLSLRVLGLLIGFGIAGALWLATWTARRMPPLLSLIFFGLNGTLIFWSDQLRAYGLGSLLIILTFAAMCFLLEKPTWPRAGILFFAAVLSVQTLYQNVVFFTASVFGGWMICWLRRDKKTALKIFAAALAAALSILPYLHYILKWQQGTAAIRPGFSFAAAADNLKTAIQFPLPQYLWIWELLVLAVIGFSVRAFFQKTPVFVRAENRMTREELQLFAGTILLSALGGYLLFLYFAALITSPWYFTPLIAIAAVCIDVSILPDALPRVFRLIVWGVVIGTFILAIPFGLRDLNCRFSNMDLVVKRLMKENSLQDYVVVVPWYFGISFNHYYKGATAWDTLPPLTDHSTYRFDLIPKNAAGLNVANQSVLDRISRTLKAGHRVWIVGLMNVPAPGRRAATSEGRFIAEHSLIFEPIDLKITGQTSDYEDVSLLQASGWKTNSP